MGAPHVLDARQGKAHVVDQVMALTDGLGVHAAINVSEHESAAGTACAVTRQHGTVVQVAQPATVSILFAELMFRDIRVKGTLIAEPQYCQQMLDDVAAHQIQVKTNVFYGLDQVPRMVELAHSGKMTGKAVCVVDTAALEQERARKPRV